MAIFYGLNSDNYSSLFGGFGGSNSSNNLGLYGSLGDLGLIQRGGYKKLCKAYYAKDNVSKIQNGVKDFVKSYNSMIDSAGESKSDNVARIAKNLTNYTKINEKVLKSVGITIGSDNKLSVNEDTLGKASISEVQDLFKGSSSFAGRVSAYATSLYTTAVANESSLYSGKGNLKALSMSSLFDTYL